MVALSTSFFGILVPTIVALIIHYNIRKVIKEANDLIVSTIYYCNQYRSSPNWFGTQRTMNNDGSGSVHLKEKDWLGETLGDRAKEAMYALDEFNLFYIKHRHILGDYSKLFKDIYDTCINLIFSRANHKYTWNSVEKFREEHIKDITKLKEYLDGVTKPKPTWIQKILVWVPTRAYRDLIKNNCIDKTT